MSRAPARGRYRVYAVSQPALDEAPTHTVGMLDAARGRSIQIDLEPTTRRFLGLRRTSVRRTQWASEGDRRWLLVGQGTGRVPAATDGGDVLAPLRAIDADLVTALDLLRLGGEHHVALPDGRRVRLACEVDARGVLRLDAHGDGFRSPVFLARADATEHDLVPDAWPPLVEAPESREEFAFVPTVWRQAVDLIRDACKPG
ncbi:MAG: hypothetical protein ACT4QF_17995 [Sporichthyaceae bacterium]